MKFWISYFLTLFGATLDFITTTIGLNLGFLEIHPNYQPVWAFLFYTMTSVIFHLTLSDKIRKIGFYILVILSFAAAINNTIVILSFS